MDEIVIILFSCARVIVLLNDILFSVYLKANLVPGELQPKGSIGIYEIEYIWVYMGGLYLLVYICCIYKKLSYQPITEQFSCPGNVNRSACCFDTLSSSSCPA